MFKSFAARLKIIWPHMLMGFALLIITGIFIPEASLFAIIMLLLAFGLGYWIGNLNSPAVRFRQKKVKKQSQDLLKLTDQVKIQTAAMESAANGIIITDTKGIIQWVNPGFTRLTGYSKEESVGHNLKMLKSDVQKPEFFKDLWTTILAGEVWRNEIVNKRKDGSLYTEEMTITPVFDERRQISNFVAIKQDISERKHLEEISALEKKRMSTELDVARNIQMSMLQLNFPPFPDREDIDIYARLIPAREVGGDFYDFFWIDEENLCFLVGDVSGKGVPAALMMAVTKTLLKSGASQEKSVARILSQVNNEISKDNDNFMFITAFMAILNTTTGYLTYSNAGHNPSFVLDRKNQALKKLDDLHGVVIGAMEGTEYKETVVRLNRGDVIFVYTDGVTEARDPKDQLFSDERLHQLLSGHSFTRSELLVDEVFEAVKIHEKGAEPADDVTALSIHFREQLEGSVVDYLFTGIRNKIENIRDFIDQFESFAQKHAIPAETVQQLNIVFDELLSNTINYAYPDQKDHEIEIKVRYYKDKLTVTLLDDGVPFNPFDRSDPDTSLSIAERDIGGLGVHLVKFLVDDYDYEYKKQIHKNSTHFIKNIN